MTLRNGNLSKVVDVHDRDVNVESSITGGPSGTHSTVVDDNIHRTMAVTNLPHCIGNPRSIGEVKRYNLDAERRRLLTSNIHGAS